MSSALAGRPPTAEPPGKSSTGALNDVKCTEETEEGISVLGLPFTSCVTFKESLEVSDAQFPQM